MLPENKKYYALDGQKVEIILTFKDKIQNRNMVVVYNGDSDYGDYKVCNEERLVEWEQSYPYQLQQDQEAKLKDYEDRKDKIITHMQEKAIKTLEMRLKLNSVFSKDGEISQIGLLVAKELGKIISNFKESDLE